MWNQNKETPPLMPPPTHPPTNPPTLPSMHPTLDGGEGENVYQYQCEIDGQITLIAVQSIEQDRGKSGNGRRHANRTEQTKLCKGHIKTEKSKKQTKRK